MPRVARLTEETFGQSRSRKTHRPRTITITQDSQASDNHGHARLTGPGQSRSRKTHRPRTITVTQDSQAG
eukprot:3849575-Prymnesium_polylepis.1